MNSITIEKLILKNNISIIDIRSHNLYVRDHIPGSISIEEKELFFHPERYLKKDREYYLYCSSGTRSRLLVNWLNKRGYHTINIIGGFHNYLLMK